jgi:hypothetical protein
MQLWFWGLYGAAIIKDRRQGPQGETSPGKIDKAWEGCQA